MQLLLLLVLDKSKANVGNYIANFLPSFIEDCQSLVQQDFVFQQDGAPAHIACQTQEWLAAHCPDLVNKDQWPPNAPDLNPLDYCNWDPLLQHIRNRGQSHQTRPNSKQCCRRYGIAYLKNPLISLCWGSENGCLHVLELTEDILNTSCRSTYLILRHSPFQG